MLVTTSESHQSSLAHMHTTGGPGANIRNVVKGWNLRREPQGRTFNYTELCPITIGCVIRSVTGTTMAAFAEQALWAALGAEADASWCTDSVGQEYNCVNFACRLRVCSSKLAVVCSIPSLRT